MKIKQAFALLTIAMAFTVAWAGPGERPRIENEDLQFIMEWKQAQRAADLAEALALTSDQVAALQSIREARDVASQDYTATREDIEARLAVTAQEVRARLESTGVLSEEDEAALRAYRAEFRALARERQMYTRELSMQIAEQLTEEQLAVLRSQRGGPDGEEAQGPRRQGQGQGQGPGRENAGEGRGGHGGRGVLVLISDVFLGQFN